MKKIFILILVTLVSISGFAQRSDRKHAQPVTSINQGSYSFSGNTFAKTSAAGDTFKLSHIAATDTIVIYSAGADSGYLTGINYWGDQAFAERYDFNGSDSTMKVIGVMAQFAGTINSSSAKTISFNVWNVSTPQYITSSMFYSGFPKVMLLADTVSITHLGIGATVDTMKLFMFGTSTYPLANSFFVGYSMDYNFNALAGDTLGITSSMDGDRTSPKTTLQVTITEVDTLVDTMINVQNATQWSDGTWHDNYTDNDSISNDLAIFPIVLIGIPNGVKGVTRNDLTFYGSYPNPAVNSAYIKFSLSRHADVTIQVMGMDGRILNTISQTNLTTGEHIIPVNTSVLPAGDYVYLIRTSNGDGMASKLSVVK